MGKSCLLKTHVRNPQGNMVESRLFNDLLNYLPSRTMAVEYYAVGTNLEFQKEVKDKAKYDENNEMTFESLRLLSKMDLSEEELVAKLDKEIGAGVMSYQQAIVKVREFNTNSQFNNKFLATIAYNNKGLYDLHITKKTPSKIAELQKTIEKQELRDKLVSQLKSHGVGVVFTEGEGGGRYSTINVEQAADGLYYLILVSHGEHINSDLAEEAGHFAVAALGHSPLVDRLIGLLNEDVQKEILGGEYENKNLGANPRREVAGTLVGRALERKLSATTPWLKLANRIVDVAKSIFAKLSGDSVRIAREEAQKIARNIANGFLSDNFDGNIANALNYKEVLNRAILPYNVKIFKNTVDALGIMAKELEAIAKDKLFNTVTAYVGTAVADRDSVITDPIIDAELISFEGLCEILTDIVDLLGPDKEIDNLLNSVDFSNSNDFYLRMSEHGESLRKVKVFVKNATIIASLLRDAVENEDRRLVLPSGQTLSNAYFNNALGQFQQINFRQMLDKLEHCIKILDSRLTSKENAFFCRFCEDIYGSKYVDTVASVIWKEHSLTKAEVDQIPIADLLEELETDIDPFHRFIGAMTNNPDIVGQIVEKAVSAANKIANDKIIKYQDRLANIQNDLKDKYNLKPGQTEMFYEKDSKGGWSGNLITKPNDKILDSNKKPVAVNYGEWEKARKEKEQECLEEFKKLHPDWESWTGFTRAYKWDLYFRPLMKKWDDENTTLIPVKDDYENVIRVEKHPNAKYKSTLYDELVKKYPGIDIYLDEINKIKKELDDLLPLGATCSWRAPLFKGTYTNTLLNKRVLMSKLKAKKEVIKEWLLNTFCEYSNSSDYGDLTTMNNPHDDLMGTPMNYAKERPNRLPIFGINKFLDMTLLSTDIFHSLLSYAAMANSYSAMNSIVDALEVGKAALENRRIVNKNGKKEKDLEEHSRAYTRYLKFLRAQVYGVATTPWSFNLFGQKILLRKIIRFIGRVATFNFLGGNVMGGVVNTGTGAIELFKEAATSEYFNLEDWAAAHGYYWKSCPSNWRHAGSLQKDDIVSLYIRYFNMLLNNEEQFRSKYNKRSRLHRLIDSSIYLPYSSGDHYMLCMSYLALAHGTKLYYNGKEETMWSLYKRVERGRKGKGKEDIEYTLEFDGLLLEHAVGKDGITFDKLNNNKVFLKDINKMKEYNMLKEMLGEIETFLNSPLATTLKFSQELWDYLAKYNLKSGDYYGILTQIQNNIYKIIWTKNDEVEYASKAREINDRLYGIYNNLDKTAWHQNWYTNAFLAMKGYALGFIERRFSNNHHSIALNNDVEGSLTTMSKLWLSIFSKEINTRFMDAFCATFFTPFIGKKIKSRLKASGFSDNQLSNMRRNFMDYMMITILYLLRLACAEPPKEEQSSYEEPSQLGGLAYYFVSRWLREQEAFNAPWGIADESLTIADAVPVGILAAYDLGKLFLYEMPGAVFADENDSDFYYLTDSPTGKFSKGDAKYINHMQRLIPYYKSIHSLNYPYDALESYEFGRKLSGR